MAKEKSPAFQFYPKEFLTDGNVASMSLQECGAYIKLLCLCWQDESIPSDQGRLANMVGISPAGFQKLWPAISACFVEDGGRLRHGRLDSERRKQEAFRQKQSMKGLASAAARSQKPTDSQPEANHGSTAVQPDTQPESNSPISDLRSVQTYTDRDARLSGTTDTTLARRAGHFIDRYKELFKEWRFGAIYHGRPHIDWANACNLVRSFEDERLEQLAVVFLNSNEPFIEKSNRSLAVFETRISWCDEQLRKAQQRRSA